MSWEGQIDDLVKKLNTAFFAIRNLRNNVNVEHPGGADVLLEYAGRDATLAFRSTGHSTFAIDSLEKYYVGSLPLHQRLFRKPDGIILSNMPE